MSSLTSRITAAPARARNSSSLRVGVVATGRGRGGGCGVSSAKMAGPVGGVVAHVIGV
jgi:hypothetical protein